MSDDVSLLMLEGLNLRLEYTVVARDTSDNDEDNWVRSEATFESMDEAEALVRLMSQFKVDDGPRYTEISIAQRYVTDWSNEEVNS